MRLTPFEEDRLLVFVAAELARRHRAAGLALDHPEAVAVMADDMLEAARSGATYEAVEAAGRDAVSPDEVMPGVRELIDEVRVEVLVGDGTRLVVLVDPLGRGPSGPDGPGAVIADRVPVDSLDGRERLTLEVRNDSRHVVMVSSHHPFDQVNPRLIFDRSAAAGFRLDLASGGTERWEPGQTPICRARASRRLRRRASLARPMTRISVEEGLARFGPTTGDRIRLGDTDLWARVETDLQASGDEPQLGYAKSLRPRMTQGEADPSELDVVITGAVVLDPIVGIVKADIGIKGGRIVGVGRAGNPAISDGIDLPIGPHTFPLPGYGLIATPGAIDSHVHLLSPNLVPAALAAGVTTLITAGFEEPPDAMERILRGLEGWPVNVGLQVCARTTQTGPLEALLDAGAVGFKIHEDYGAYPELIDATLAFAEEHDVSVCLHTDGLHETAELEDTVAAIAGRTVHAYHVEGTGGGHIPDVIGLVREKHVICSSTTPTIPFGRNAPAEHVAMVLPNHGGSWNRPADVELARSRIHPATMAAEGPLHELGAIAIVNSDSQGMGRIMETVRRTFQLAHVMKAWRTTDAGMGHPGLPVESDDPHDDNDRILRYLAKVTLEPAITHGISHEVGSLTPGRLADIVLWKPAFFGAKPEVVLKAGHTAWAPHGDGNATVVGAEPTRYAPDWAGLPHAAASLAVTFVSSRADPHSLTRRLATQRRIVPVRGCRGLTRDDLSRNCEAVPIEVDPRDGRVTLAGRPLRVEPVEEVPLSRRYFLR